MSNLLIEIGLEEVPARFINDCLIDLNKKLQTELQKARLVTNETTFQTLGTARRFAILIESLELNQAAITNEVEGPPLTIAKSDSGEWLPPAIGFAKKCGI